VKTQTLEHRGRDLCAPISAAADERYAEPDFASVERGGPCEEGANEAATL